MTVLLLDVDGPLAAFDRRFFARCNEEGWPLDCTLDTQRHRFATDHLPDRHHREAARRMVNTAGWFRDLPVTPGALRGLYTLADHADVWLCTKPLEANPTCRDDKAAWVAEQFGPNWERRLIITPDKSMIAGDILLDDAPHPDWYAKASWRPVIFPTHWNGEGSKWAGLPRWRWGDHIDALLQPPLIPRGVSA